MDQETPHFELRRVYDHGAEQDEPQIYPILDLPMETRMNRRGFLGAGLTVGAVLTWVTGCSTPPARPPKRSLKNPPTAEPVKKPAPQVEVAAEAKPATPAEQSHSCAADIKAHTGDVFSLAFSADGKWLASGSGDNTLKLWALPEGKFQRTLKRHTGGVRTVRFSTDGRWLISADSQRKVNLWKLATGKLHQSFNAGPYFEISSDGGWLVTTSSKSKNDVAVRRFPSGELYKAIPGHVGSITDLAISPDGRWLASAAEDLSVEVWSLPDGKNHLTLWRHTRDASGLAFSPDGQLLASGARNNAVKLWRVSDGSEVATLSGHRGAVVALAISPDGKWIATGSIDRTVKLWRLTDGSLQATLRGHKMPVRGVAFSPDGRWLASGAADSTIRMWSIPGGDPLNCLFDTSTMSSKKKANQYNTTNAYGETITYTLPCGSPIPAGAVCTCNCVPGTYSAPVTQRRTQRYCSCNKVCTCVPVYYCQAHRLLDTDPIVRIMAEELLLIMGGRGMDYLRWAASEVGDALRARILGMIDAVSQGRSPDTNRWPATHVLKRYLDHPEPVTALMAGQLLLQRRYDPGSKVARSTLRKAERIVASGDERHRMVRAQVEMYSAENG